MKARLFTEAELQEVLAEARRYKSLDLELTPVQRLALDYQESRAALISAEAELRTNKTHLGFLRDTMIAYFLQRNEPRAVITTRYRKEAVAVLPSKRRRYGLHVQPAQTALTPEERNDFLALPSSELELALVVQVLELADSEEDVENAEGRPRLVILDGGKREG